MPRFNTEGPVVTRDHYCVPPLEQVNLDEIPERVRDTRYFVLHAPRQAGRTSTLLALRGLRIFRREERIDDRMITVWGM